MPQKNESKKPSNQKFNQDFAKIVAKCWNDEDYKERFIKNPKQLLKEEGINIGDSVKVQIHENTDKEWNFIIPPKGKEPLSEDELKNLSGGSLSGVGCDACGGG